MTYGLHIVCSIRRRLYVMYASCVSARLCVMLVMLFVFL